MRSAERAIYILKNFLNCRYIGISDANMQEEGSFRCDGEMFLLDQR